VSDIRADVSSVSATKGTGPRITPAQLPSQPADADTPARGEPAAGTPLLEVCDLVTRYPVRRGLTEAAMRKPRRFVHAVDGVSFTLGRGEMMALVGESGCGKTSTVQTILGMVEPASGAVRLNGTDIAGLPERKMRPLRRIVQMIYQDPYESLDPRFRVSQTVEEPMLVHGIGRSSAERQELIIKALEEAGLSPADAYLDRYPHELSGGQRQRVAIATALVLGPDLLLADEPVSMLDVSVRAGVLSLLDGLRRTADMGILMITHDLSTAAHFADKIAVMYLGRIVEFGTAAEVVRHPQHPYTKALLSVVPKRDPRDRAVPQILTGETPDPVDVPSGCRFHPRCPLAVEKCRTQDPALRLPVVSTPVVSTPVVSTPVVSTPVVSTPVVSTAAAGMAGHLAACHLV
jgi:oligopeptide/dipeptide ABC transporter ATP-binding protein